MSFNVTAGNGRVAEKEKLILWSLEFNYVVQLTCLLYFEDDSNTPKNSMQKCA